MKTIFRSALACTIMTSAGVIAISAMTVVPSGVELHKKIQSGAFVVLAAWLLIVFIGIAIGPGVPYQDPSPVMRALEIRQERRSNGVAFAGLCIFTSGILWGTSRWFVRRCSHRKSHDHTTV